MARRKRGLIGNVVQNIAALPWWAGIALAVAAYFVLHHFAVVEISARANARGTAVYVGMQLIKTLAFYGQYLVPALLVMALLCPSDTDAGLVTTDNLLNPAPPRRAGTNDGNRL